MGKPKVERITLLPPVARGKGRYPDTRGFQVMDRTLVEINMFSIQGLRRDRLWDNCCLP